MTPAVDVVRAKRDGAELSDELRVAPGAEPNAEPGPGPGAELSAQPGAELSGERHEQCLAAVTAGAAAGAS